MPAVGREQLYFSVLSAGSWVGALLCSVLGSAPEGSALTLLPVESLVGDSTPIGVTGTPDESQLETRPPSGGLRRSSLEPRRMARPQRWSFERF